MTYGKKTLAFSWFFDCLFNRISNVTKKKGRLDWNSEVSPVFSSNNYHR